MHRAHCHQLRVECHCHSSSFPAATFDVSDPGLSFAKNMDSKSCTRSAAAVPVTSAAQDCINTSHQRHPTHRHILGLLTMIIYRCYFHKVCTPACAISTMITDAEDTDGNAYTKLRPASPLRIRLSSRVVQPPASGVPAADELSAKRYIPQQTQQLLTCWGKARIYSLLSVNVRPY